MKNITKFCLGVLTQFLGAIAATVAMYVCSFVLQISGLYDDEMAKTLYLPVIMMLPVLILYIVWFWRRVKKLTSGEYTDRSPRNYNRPSRFLLALCLHYVTGILAMIPFFFKHFMEIGVSMLPSLGICEVFLLIANYFCFWIFFPIANDAY